MKFIVEITIYDILGYKFAKELEKAIKGLSALAQALKNPDSINTALFQVAVRYGLSFAAASVERLSLPIVVEPLLSHYNPGVILGMKLESTQQIPTSIVSSLIERFLEGFGEALRELVEAQG